MSKIRPLMHVRRRAKGFTLLEMMLVVVIIGLLVGVAVINLAGQSDVARATTTKASLQTYQNAITQFYTRTGAYPATLQALIPADMGKLKKDAWKHDFVYFLTQDSTGHPYTLFSMGADGQPSTQDDINVWNMDE